MRFFAEARRRRQAVFGRIGCNRPRSSFISMTRTIKAAWGGLGVSAVALGLKFAAYWVTGSIALYSDALETTIIVVGAVTALIALWYGERPADASPPYVHQKAENHFRYKTPVQN